MGDIDFRIDVGARTIEAVSEDHGATMEDVYRGLQDEFFDRRDLWLEPVPLEFDDSSELITQYKSGTCLFYVCRSYRAVNGWSVKFRGPKGELMFEERRDAP